MAEYPQGWAPSVIDNQGGQGWGASDRFGPKPPSPDSVAPRGTPAWRQAFNTQRDWMGKQFFVGATLADMGFADVKGKGKHAYTALRAGDFGGFRQDWFNAAKSSPRSYYGPGTGIRTPVPSGTMGSGRVESPGAPSLTSSSFAPPGGGFAPPATSPGFQPPTNPSAIQPTGMLIRRGRRPLTLRGFAGG